MKKTCSYWKDGTTECPIRKGKTPICLSPTWEDCEYGGKDTRGLSGATTGLGHLLTQYIDICVHHYMETHEMMHHKKDLKSTGEDAEHLCEHQKEIDRLRNEIE